MSLWVVGAGLGRTGTTSLKAALEQLLGGPCYHMLEVRERPADPDAWGDAYEGHPPAWTEFSAATPRRWTGPRPRSGLSAPRSPMR